MYIVGKLCISAFRAKRLKISSLRPINRDIFSIRFRKDFTSLPHSVSYFQEVFYQCRYFPKLSYWYQYHSKVLIYWRSKFHFDISNSATTAVFSPLLKPQWKAPGSVIIASPWCWTILTTSIPFSLMRSGFITKHLCRQKFSQKFSVIVGKSCLARSKTFQESFDWTMYQIFGAPSVSIFILYKSMQSCKMSKFLHSPREDRRFGTFGSIFRLFVSVLRAFSWGWPSDAAKSLASPHCGQALAGSRESRDPGIWGWWKSWDFRNWNPGIFWDFALAEPIN